MIGQGRGFLIAVASFACLLAAESATEAWLAETAFQRKHCWPKAAGLALAAVMVWLLRGLLGAGRTGEK